MRRPARPEPGVSFRLALPGMPLWGVRNEDLQLIDRADAQHHLVTRDDVAASGLSSQQWCDRLDGGMWLPAADNVFRHRATPATWELRVRAAALSLGRDAALFGPTAAQWWGLEGFSDDRIGSWCLASADRSTRACSCIRPGGGAPPISSRTTVCAPHPPPARSSISQRQATAQTRSRRPSTRLSGFG